MADHVGINAANRKDVVLNAIYLTDEICGIAVYLVGNAS